MGREGDVYMTFLTFSNTAGELRVPILRRHIYRCDNRTLSPTYTRRRRRCRSRRRHRVVCIRSEVKKKNIHTHTPLRSFEHFCWTNICVVRACGVLCVCLCVYSLLNVNNVLQISPFVRVSLGNTL